MGRRCKECRVVIEDPNFTGKFCNRCKEVRYRREMGETQAEANERYIRQNTVRRPKDISYVHHPLCTCGADYMLVSLEESQGPCKHRKVR